MGVLPDALRIVFCKIEEKTEPFFDHDVSAALQTFHKDQEEAGHDRPPVFGTALVACAVHWVTKCMPGP
jgi:hypothetical protein